MARWKPDPSQPFGPAEHIGRRLFDEPKLVGAEGQKPGITALYRKDPKPLREDLPKIFALLAEKKIDPLVTRTFALLEARQAIECLATGSVEGKIVLMKS